MNKKSENTQRIKYLIDNKIIKNIKKDLVKYSVKDMKIDLQEVRWFLTERGFHDEARLTIRVMNILDYLDICKEEILDDLLIISDAVHKVEEKEKEMNRRAITSRIQFQGKVSKLIKEKKECDTIKKYDVVIIPTQGGLHHSIVYDIVCDDNVLCYPITTSSTRSLRILGNRSHVIQNCGCPEYDGNVLSSAATYISIQKASLSKIGHIKNHEEIDNAILGFYNI